MKKGILVILLLLMALGLVSCAGRTKLRDNKSLEEADSLPSVSQDVEHKIVDAKGPYYASADEVVAASSLALVGKKVSEKHVAFPIENGIQDAFTQSVILVEKILKPFEGSDIKGGDEISVLEPEWMDADQRVIYHMSGYSKMSVGGEYALYLGYNESQDLFYPTGCIFGKIPLDKEEKILFQEDDLSEIRRVWQDLYPKQE